MRNRPPRQEEEHSSLHSLSFSLFQVSGRTLPNLSNNGVKSDEMHNGGCTHAACNTGFGAVVGVYQERDYLQTVCTGVYIQRGAYPGVYIGYISLPA